MVLVPPKSPDPHQKYQLVVVFAGDDAQAESRLIEAEDLLREELWTGIISGHEVGSGTTRLLVVTDAPAHCLADLVHRLQWIGMAPAAATQQPVTADHSGQLVLLGDAEPLAIVNSLVLGA